MKNNEKTSRSLNKILRKVIAEDHTAKLADIWL